jgi:hypothetical protein
MTLEHKVVVVAGPAREKFKSVQQGYKPLFFLDRSTVPPEMMALCKDTGTDHLELNCSWRHIGNTPDNDLVLIVDSNPLKFNLFLVYDPESEVNPGIIVATFSKPVPIAS